MSPNSTASWRSFPKPQIGVSAVMPPAGMKNILYINLSYVLTSIHCYQRSWTLTAVGLRNCHLVRQSINLTWQSLPQSPRWDFPPRLNSEEVFPQNYVSFFVLVCWKSKSVMACPVWSCFDAYRAGGNIIVCSCGSVLVKGEGKFTQTERALRNTGAFRVDNVVMISSGPVWPSLMLLWMEVDKPSLVFSIALSSMPSAISTVCTAIIVSCQLVCLCWLPYCTVSICCFSPKSSHEFTLL